MTRTHDQVIHCPNCGSLITTETSFGRWVRNNPNLDASRTGLCVMDMDYVFHRFRPNELGRDFQCVMIVEVKTRNGKMSPAQIDTAHIIGQMTRNRRQTPTNNMRRQAGNGFAKVYSAMRKQDVNVRSFGFHLLTFEGLGPDDSQWIKWDNTIIDANQLEGLLLFDLDPDTLKPMDWRSHHVQYRQGNFHGLLESHEQ